MKNLHIFFSFFLFVMLYGSAYCQEDHDLFTKKSLNIGTDNENRFYDNTSIIIPELITPNPVKDIYGYNEQGPFIVDWMDDDIIVDSGAVATAGFRQAVIKFGPDFSMYAVVNKKTVSGQFNSRLNIFRSDDGGLNWVRIYSLMSPTNYLGQFSFVVENNTPSNPDSTRVIVFYTLSANSNLNSSVLNVLSVKRDGTAPLGGNLLIATSGFKLFNPSAVSSVRYGGPNSGFGVVVGEYNNTTDASRSFRFLRTTDFGASFQTTSLIDPGYGTFNDYFPSASFKKGSIDSVYIAVERRSASDTLVRVIITPWQPTASATTNFLTSGPDNYEKPKITILQTDPAEKIMITSVKNSGIPVYHYSTDGGVSWTIDAALGDGNQKDIRYIDCYSDPDTTGGGNFIVGYQDAFFSTSDSITVRRGIIGNMGSFNYLINQTKPTGFLSPSVTIYKYTPMGGTLEKRSAVMFVGQGTINAFYDQENLPTGIVNHNTLATDFKLSQNYPNPFNPSTKIDFSIPHASNVKLVVYDMLGKEVATLVNKNLISGSYTYEFNGLGLASGVYIYRINVDGNNGSFNEVKKMMLIK
jgi:hypothetical protein